MNSFSSESISDTTCCILPTLLRSAVECEEYCWLVMRCANHAGDAGRTSVRSIFPCMRPKRSIQLNSVILDGLPSGCVNASVGSSLAQYSSSHSNGISASKLQHSEIREILINSSQSNDSLLVVIVVWSPQFMAHAAVHRNQTPVHCIKMRACGGREDGLTRKRASSSRLPRSASHCTPSADAHPCPVPCASRVRR